MTTTITHSGKVTPMPIKHQLLIYLTLIGGAAFLAGVEHQYESLDAQYQPASYCSTHGYNETLCLKVGTLP